jgi:hypothetical protein
MVRKVAPACVQAVIQLDGLRRRDYHDGGSEPLCRTNYCIRSPLQFIISVSYICSVQGVRTSSSARDTAEGQVLPAGTRAHLLTLQPEVAHQRRHDRDRRVPPLGPHTARAAARDGDGACLLPRVSNHAKQTHSAAAATATASAVRPPAMTDSGDDDVLRTNDEGGDDRHSPPS